MVILEWMNVVYTDGYSNLTIKKNGTNSRFSQRELDGRQYLLKIFIDPTDSKRAVVDQFRRLSYDKENAFPIGKVYVYDRDEGYVSKYYEGAVDFSCNLCSMIPYDIRYSATLDISSQLQFLHENGFIVNDIRLTNNLISFKEHCGLMVDFEDMLLESSYEDNYKDSVAYYYFYKKGHDEKLPPSKWDDAKKQFLCCASLLLENDFEMLAICNSDQVLLEKFKFDKEIYEFTRQLFHSDNVLYFNEIAPKFQDEEKINFCKKI